MSLLLSFLSTENQYLTIPFLRITATYPREHHGSSDANDLNDLNSMESLTVTRLRPGAYACQPSSQKYSLPARHTASDAVTIGRRLSQDLKRRREARIPDYDRRQPKEGCIQTNDFLGLFECATDIKVAYALVEGLVALPLICKI
ncbi:hypothetical protein CIB48_g3865 [Xylaria polymorpha]|nr:hypothetical protein CIB48_g3865 [Xylaria polymorpha]